MSLAYLGTSAFAADVLRRLAASPHRPPSSSPARPPEGRGRRLASPPVADAARELGLALEQPADVHALDLSGHEDVVVCAYGALLAEPLLSHPGLLNVHPSLLPRWRGAAPIERAIMAGDAETGVCIMRMVAELDAGPVCLRAAEPIRDDDDFGTLSARLQVLAAELVVRALDERPACAEQEGEMVYAEKIGAADRALDPARSGEENARVVRALSPHIGAKAGELGVWRARPGGGRRPRRRADGPRRPRPLGRPRAARGPAAGRPPDGGGGLRAGARRMTDAPERLDLAGRTVTDLRLTDVDLDAPDLANLRAPGGSMQHVRIRAGRLTGLGWTGGVVRACSFTGCRANLAGFAGARLSDVRFEDCDLRDSDFSDAALREVAFAGCDLTGADLSGSGSSAAPCATAGSTGCASRRR